MGSGKQCDESLSVILSSSWNTRTKIDQWQALAMALGFFREARPGPIQEKKYWNLIRGSSAFFWAFTKLNCFVSEVVSVDVWLQSLGVRAPGLANVEILQNAAKTCPVGRCSSESHHVCMHACVHTYVKARAAFLNCFPFYVLRQGLSLNLTLTHPCSPALHAGS